MREFAEVTKITWPIDRMLDFFVALQKAMKVIKLEKKECNVFEFLVGCLWVQRRFITYFTEFAFWFE